MRLMVHVYIYPVNPLSLWLDRRRLRFLPSVMIELTAQCNLGLLHIHQPSDTWHELECAVNASVLIHSYIFIIHIHKYSQIIVSLWTDLLDRITITIVMYVLCGYRRHIYKGCVWCTWWQGTSEITDGRFK